MTQMIKVALMDRTDTELNWSTVNPILRKGMRANTIDPVTGLVTKYKVGDGAHTWSDTPYFGEATAGGTAELAPLTVSTTDAITANQAVFLNTDGTISGLKATGSLAAAMMSQVSPTTTVSSYSQGYQYGSMAMAFNTRTKRIMTFRLFAPDRNVALYDIAANGTVTVRTTWSHTTVGSPGTNMNIPGLAYNEQDDHFLVTGDSRYIGIIRETADGTLSATPVVLQTAATIGDGTNPTWIRPFYNAQTGDMYLVAYYDTSRKLIITNVIVTGNTISIDASNKLTVNDVYLSAYRNCGIVFDSVRQQFVLAVRAADAKSVGVRFIGRNADRSWTVSSSQTLFTSPTNANFDGVSVDVAADGTAVINAIDRYASLTTTNTSAYGFDLVWAVFDTLGGIATNVSTHRYARAIPTTGRLSASIDSSSKRIFTAYNANNSTSSPLMVMSMAYDPVTHVMDSAAASTKIYTTTDFGSASYYVADGIWLTIPTMPGFRVLATLPSSGPQADAGSFRFWLTSFRDAINDSNAQGFLGLAKTNAADGSVDIYRRGDVATLSGLVGGSRYYLNRYTGAIDTSGHIYVGRALSATKLLLEF